MITSYQGERQMISRDALQRIQELGADLAEARAKGSVDVRHTMCGSRVEGRRSEGGITMNPRQRLRRIRELKLDLAEARVKGSADVGRIEAELENQNKALRSSMRGVDAVGQERAVRR